MKIAVYAREVQVGDHIKMFERSETQVVQSMQRDGSTVSIFLNGYGWQHVSPGTPFVLIARPRPAGKSKDDMFNDVVEAMIRASAADLDVLERNLPTLLEAIVAYEVSKD